MANFNANQLRKNEKLFINELTKVITINCPEYSSSEIKLFVKRIVKVTKAVAIKPNYSSCKQLNHSTEKNEKLFKNELTNKLVKNYPEYSSNDINLFVDRVINEAEAAKSNCDSYNQHDNSTNNNYQ